MASLHCRVFVGCRIGRRAVSEWRIWRMDAGTNNINADDNGAVLVVVAAVATTTTTSALGGPDVIVIVIAGVYNVILHGIEVHMQ